MYSRSSFLGFFLLLFSYGRVKPNSKPCTKFCVFIAPGHKPGHVYPELQPTCADARAHKDACCMPRDIDLHFLRDVAIFDFKSCASHCNTELETLYDQYRIKIMLIFAIRQRKTKIMICFISTSGKSHGSFTSKRC